MRSLRLRLAVVLVLTCVQLGVGLPAEAVSCPAGKHIFIRAGSTNTRWGVRGRIKVPNNNLDDCSGAATFMTVHFSNCSGIPCGTQVEIGIKNRPSGPVIFTEKQINGEVLRYDEITTAGFNFWIPLRLRVTQSGDVFFHYDLGSGYVTTWSSPYNINWAPAYPMGETEKVGDDTQMFSHHDGLRYITSTWNEVAWSSMKCVYDAAPGWSWDPVSGSNNAYNVVNVGGNSCDPA